MSSSHQSNSKGSRVLLKVGGRKHLGEERWAAALNLFDEIHCASIYREDSWNVDNEHIHQYELKKNKINHLLTGIILRTRKYRYLYVFNWLIIILLRISNIAWIKKIKNCKATFALCSYGDYDRSDLAYLILKPAINCKIVRSYKETRVGYNFLEHQTLSHIDTISLYCKELKSFLERKYGVDFFEGKKVVTGLDENVLPSCILSNIRHQQKISSRDGKKHMVILSYRADSAPDRERDQARYYYVDTIKTLIEAGLIVHLHCAVYNELQGINKYLDLKKQFPDCFFMEKPLEMKRDSSLNEWISSCEILSRYDYGLLHNIAEGSSVSEFDAINVPHRFFAYQAANVTPIICRGENTVLCRMFEEKKCGIVYSSIKELTKENKMDLHYIKTTYEDYLTKLLNL